MGLFGKRRAVTDDARDAAAEIARSARSALRDARAEAGAQIDAARGEGGGARLGGVLGTAIAGIAVLGAGALAAQWLRERSEQEPEYDLLREDGAISLRRYRPMNVAVTDANGSLRQAMDTGFRRLFAYITGKVRPSGDDTRIAMTVPVLAAPTDHPGAWRVRFVMPRGKPVQALPRPGAGVEIEQVPARTVGVVRFAGRVTDRATAKGEADRLRAWLTAQNLVAKGEPEFAAYNSPMIPGAMRRNEWWIEVAEPAR